MNIPALAELDTPRLRLRVCRPEDADAVFAAEADSIAELRRWFWWCHPEHSRERCGAWAASRVAAWRNRDEYSFLAFEKQNGTLVGCVWLNGIDRLALRASLGYWLRSGFEGRGLALEATTAVVRWGFDQLGALRIEIVVAVENRRSQRLAERIGARHEGVARSRLRVNGVSADAHVYSVLPGELVER